MNEVLIVDDEAAMRVALEANFRRRGWQVQTAEDVRDALAKFRAAPSMVVVTDMRMPDGDGLRVMQGVRMLLPDAAHGARSGASGREVRGSFGGVSRGD